MLNGDFLAEKVASWVLSKHQVRFVAHDYTIGHLLAVAENNSMWDDITFDAASRRHPHDVTVAEEAKSRRASRLLAPERRLSGASLLVERGADRGNDPRTLLGLKKAPLAVAYTN